MRPATQTPQNVQIMPRSIGWAVLSGDLIGSSDLSSENLDLAFEILNDAAIDLSNFMGDPQNIGFARNRGDGWQMLIDRPNVALRAALYVRARLLSENTAFRTRISMATGSIESRPRNLNEARGPVFVASGHSLDAMPINVTLAHADGGAIAAATRLADFVSSGWTQAQARAVHLILWPDRPSRTKIAAQIGVSRQAVDQSLASAGIPAILDALEAIEASG